MRSRLPTSRLVRVLSGAIQLAVLVLLTLWAARILPRRSGIDHFNAVRSLETLKDPGLGLYLAPLAAGLGLLALLRRPFLARPEVTAAVVGAGLIGLSAPLLSVVGHQALLLVCAALLAGLVAVHFGPAAKAAQVPWARYVPWILWIGLTAVHAAYSMHRHAWYGSGSWDHGCMIHNFYRASRFLNSTSTVLGDVDFLGDHFMVGIYLYAPLTWLNASGYMLLLIQSVNLAAVGPAIYLMARARGFTMGPATALALAVGLSFGLQSAAYFDSHEIAVGFGFLAWGLWAFETGRLRAATVLFILFSLFKESLGAYVVGLGLLALWRGLRGDDRRLLKYGVAWVVYGGVWFVLVNRVFMPTLIARANPPEPHETFGDFGPTVFEAAIGIVTHPLKAVAAVFVPDEKLSSLGVTFGGTGWLALLSPQVGIAALPLFAERFLSSKQTMWQMGYHYAAPLSLYAGWAAVRGWSVAERLLRRTLRRLGGREVGASGILVAYVVLSAVGINGVGYRHTSNYFRWSEPYFSTPPRKAAHDEAVALLEDQGRDARLAVQNRILPHLADRPVIYRLGDYKKADWVLLSVGESAWPWHDSYPRQLARTLSRDPAWRLVFAQETTAVFVRVEVSDLPEAKPTPGLGLPSAPVSRPRLKATPPGLKGAVPGAASKPQDRLDSPDSNRYKAPE